MANNSTCASCGCTNTPGTNFCRQCGAPSAASPSPDWYYADAHERPRSRLPWAIGGVLLCVGIAGGLWYSERLNSPSGTAVVPEAESGTGMPHHTVDNSRPSQAAASGSATLLPQFAALAAASRLQLNALRLSNQSRNAIEGNAQAFEAFKATREEVDEDIKTLNDRFGDAAGVSGTINTVTNTWDPLARRADEVLGSQAQVLALAGRADSFTGKVPQLQAQLNEVVRGLASGGATSGQVFTALQQVVTSAAMVRRIAELRAGGEGAQVAADALGRDAAVFDRSMNALRNGGGDIAKVAAAGAVGPLNQANTLWQGMKTDLDAIVGDSRRLIGAQTSAAALATGSDKLLSDSENLFAALISFAHLDATEVTTMGESHVAANPDRSEPDGHEFIGTWQNLKDSSDLQTITREGNQFILTSSRGEKVMPVYDKAKHVLRIQRGPFGELVISHRKSTDTLLGDGDEYRRLE